MLVEGAQKNETESLRPKIQALLPTAKHCLQDTKEQIYQYLYYVLLYTEPFIPLFILFIRER